MSFSHYSRSSRRQRTRNDEFYYITKPSKLSMDKLNELLELQASQIVINLSDVKFGLENYLNANLLGDDLLEKFILLLLKAFECFSLKSKLATYIDKVLASNYFTQNVFEHLIKGKSRNEYKVDFIRTVLRMCSALVSIDSAASGKLGQVRIRLESLILNDVKNLELVDEWHKFLKLELESIESSSMSKKPMLLKETLDEQMELVNDFTLLSIVPTLGDILDTTTGAEKSLRKNRIDGPYVNVHEYLDVHFKLLREDFLRPLRQGVHELKRIVSTTESGELNLSRESVHRIKQIESLNAYFDVRMRSCATTDLGVCYSMKLSRELMDSVNWEQSKRFIFGLWFFYFFLPRTCKFKYPNSIEEMQL